MIIGLTIVAIVAVLALDAFSVFIGYSIGMLTAVVVLAAKIEVERKLG